MSELNTVTISLDEYNDFRASKEKLMLILSSNVGLFELDAQLSGSQTKVSELMEALSNANKEVCKTKQLLLDERLDRMKEVKIIWSWTTDEFIDWKKNIEFR